MPRVSLRRLRVIHWTFIQLYRDAETQGSWRSSVRAPPALDLVTLTADEPWTKQLRLVRDMVKNGWPALLAALSFIISTNLSDDLFVEVLSSYQAMTNVSGMLALSTPRDAFFTSLAKFYRILLSTNFSKGS